jgi:hypothetical protein
MLTQDAHITECIKTEPNHIAFPQEASKRAEAFDPVSLKRELVHVAPQLSSAETRRSGCVIQENNSLWLAAAREE